MSQPKDKLFIIRKYVKARSAAEAIRKDSKTPVDEVWIDEVWIDDDWKKQGNLAEAIGFIRETKSDEQ